jgi:hypothetical protein
MNAVFVEQVAGEVDVENPPDPQFVFVRQFNINTKTLTYLGRVTFDSPSDELTVMLPQLARLLAAASAPPAVAAEQSGSTPLVLDSPTAVNPSAAPATPLASPAAADASPTSLLLYTFDGRVGNELQFQVTFEEAELRRGSELLIQLRPTDADLARDPALLASKWQELKDNELEVSFDEFEHPSVCLLPPFLNSSSSAFLHYSSSFSSSFLLLFLSPHSLLFPL